MEMTRGSMDSESGPTNAIIIIIIIIITSSVAGVVKRPSVRPYPTWCGCTSVESTRPVQTSSSQQPIDLADYLSITKSLGQFLNFPNWFLKPVRPSVRPSVPSIDNNSGGFAAERPQQIDR